MKKFFESDAWGWIRLGMELAVIAMLVIVLVMILHDVGLAESEGQCWVLCDPESYVIIRTAPRKTGIEVGGATCGTRLLTDSEEKKNYIHVTDLSAEYDSGWISLRYIVFDEPKEINRTMVVQAQGRVACRKWVDGKITKWFYTGDTVFVYWASPSWSVTNRGYIQTQFLVEAGDECD